MFPCHAISLKMLLSAFFAAMMLVGAIGYVVDQDMERSDRAREKLKATSLFKEGQMVESVIDERRGMVVRVICRNVECRYLVRFAAQTERTNARWGEDGDIQARPYATVTMREFELRGVKQ